MVFSKSLILWFHQQIIEPPLDKTNKSACAPSEDSDQPGQAPSLTRIFTVSMKKAWVLSYPLSTQRRLWSDWVDAQADLSLGWVHSHFVGFVMRRLIWFCSITETSPCAIGNCRKWLLYNCFMSLSLIVIQTNIKFLKITFTWTNIW